MISLNKLILDFKRINLINSKSFVNEKIEYDNLVFIGKFIESYNSYDQLNELLLLEFKNKSMLSILNIEVKEFIEKYEMNNVFFQSIDLRKIENEILPYYDKHVLFFIKLKKNEALKNYTYFQERIKENAYGKITEDEKRLNTSNYIKAREKFEHISNEISEIEEEVMQNVRYIYFKYEVILMISNHIKTNLSKISEFNIPIIEENISIVNNSKNTEVYFDTELTGAIHKICNNTIFETINEVSFYYEINLIKAENKLVIKGDNIMKVYFLIFKLKNKIIDSKKRKEWINNILNKLKLEEKNYNSKASSIINESSETSKDFVNDLNIILPTKIK